MAFGWPPFNLVSGGISPVLTTALSGWTGSSAITTVGTLGTLSVAGTAAGGLAVGGGYYSHVLAAFGFNGNPLTQTHQVGVYSALSANANANGVGSFNGGFETAIGTQAGAFTLEKAVNFATGSMALGAGSAITRTWGLSTYEEIVGSNNAAIATWDATFSGNWFIYYPGTRPSYIGGNITVGEELFRNASNDFVRLSGGDGGGSGANVLLFGQTHASHANQMQLNASAGIVVSASLQVTTGFGCNGATAQASVASGGALAAYGAGANGFDTAGHASALYAMVVAIRGALVANGIMS